MKAGFVQGHFPFDSVFSPGLGLWHGCSERGGCTVASHALAVPTGISAFVLGVMNLQRSRRLCVGKTLGHSHPLAFYANGPVSLFNGSFAFSSFFSLYSLAFQTDECRALVERERAEAFVLVDSRRLMSRDVRRK